MFILRRSRHNPHILPIKDNSWEASATFNWCPTEYNGDIHVLYRAMSHPELLGRDKLSTSTIGHAVSTEELHFENRERFIYPEQEWERFGCEDPRVTKIDDKYYIFYTAVSEFPFKPEGIRVAVAITKDFKNIEERHLVTPFNAKAMTLFPEKVDGKYMVALTVHTDMPPSRIAFATFERIEDIWSHDYWNKWYENWEKYTIDPRRYEHDHVEVGAPPLLTPSGWLFIYSHIQEYGQHNQTFGIEALLLDRDNPHDIIGRTKGPIMVPEALYEERGNVQNIVFPSGARLTGDDLEIYYGAADTTCCTANLSLEKLLQSLLPERFDKSVSRYKENPIITPIEEHEWEAFATFNPAAIDIDGNVNIIYRAMSKSGVSTMGLAISKNGLHVDERLPEPIYVPRESFEIKGSPGNSGCEDPRVVEVEGTDRLYMFYTAYDGIEAPRVAVSCITKTDFLNRDWEKWSSPSILTPPGIMDKDTAIFPKKIKGKYIVIHRISDVICIDFFDTLDFETEKVDTCVQVVKPRKGMWDGVKIGIAGPPMETKHGWLQIYHGVSTGGTYRLGALLLDINDPTTIIARTTAPLMEPIKQYEMEGQVNNVIFPCGQVEREGMLYIYYGGADSVIGVGTIPMSDIFSMLDK